MAAHKHAEVIKAWADGLSVQWRDPDDLSHTWEDVGDGGTPSFGEDLEYRIKPAEPEREYPEVYATEEEVIAAWTPPYGWKGLKDFADKALRHSLDKGKVVTRAEFDRAVGDRQKRDMAVAKHIINTFVLTGKRMNSDAAIEAIIAELK